MAGSLRPGTPAPELEARNQHGETVRLSQLRGTPVALVFFPWAFTTVCHGELSELRDRADDFAAAGVRVLAVSCDPVYALRAWSDRESFGFDLLSDHWPHGAIARAYGVFDAELGVAVRGSFAVDADGRLLWSVLNPLGQARPVADLLAAFGAGTER